MYSDSQPSSDVLERVVMYVAVKPACLAYRKRVCGTAQVHKWTGIPSLPAHAMNKPTALCHAVLVYYVGETVVCDWPQPRGLAQQVNSKHLRQY